MRFVVPKSEAQQSLAQLFRCRERLVHQRTELVNALRSSLYEFGHTIPQGIGSLAYIEKIIENANCDLPALVREECGDLLMQIAEQTKRIAAKTKQIGILAAKSETSQRLQTMPGIGPLSALAVEAFAPPIACFKRGRDFAAWLGLVPRQYSSGGKEHLGKISKAGQPDIRRATDHGRNVEVELARSQVSARRILVGSHAAKKTANARCGRLGEQDGTSNLGHAVERSGLSISDANCRCITEVQCLADQRR